MAGSTTVDCAEHGTARKAFICRHLLKGSGIGWFDSGVTPEAPFPDAWCAACERVRVAEGGASGDWNERSESFASVTLVCSQCYLQIRGRNRGRAIEPV